MLYNLVFTEGRHCVSQNNVSGPSVKYLCLDQVFKKKYSRLYFVVKSLKGFGWNIVGPTLQTVAQHPSIVSTGPMYRVIWCF